MTKRRTALIVLLALLIGGYAGWFYAGWSNPWAKGVLEIHGASGVMALPSPLPSATGEAAVGGTTDEVAFLSPAPAVSACKIKKFKIEAGSENQETALVNMADLTPTDLECIIDQANKSQSEVFRLAIEHCQKTPQTCQIRGGFGPLFGIQSLGISIKGVPDYAPIH